MVDPHRIREDVARWHRHRKVTLDTIAIGGSLEVLAWLARDAGGSYRQLRQARRGHVVQAPPAGLRSGAGPAI